MAIEKKSEKVSEKKQVDESSLVKSDERLIYIIPPFTSPNSKTFVEISGNEYIVEINSENEGVISFTHEKRVEILEKLESEKWRIK
jgi:hypothetical protein